MKLSVSIRRAMRHQELRPNEFAQKAGVARSTLFNLLAGQEPSLETVRKLRAVGVSIPRELLAV
jgi:predicted transcriptional regulator